MSNSNFTDINSIYRYIYTLLYSFPAPDIIIIRFSKDMVRKNMVSTFHQSCALLLGVPQANFIYSLSQPFIEEANLEITSSDMNYLFDNEFMPNPNV
jgi:hypothetical protein